MNLLSKKLNKKGFTIIELIVVIAVLAVLVLLALPRFSDYVERGRLARVQNDVRAVENKVHEYLIEYNLTGERIDLNSIGDDKSIYSKRGPLEEVPVGDFFEVNGLDLVRDANSKLDGTFVANNRGEVLYIGGAYTGEFTKPSEGSSSGGTTTQEDYDGVVVLESEQLFYISSVMFNPDLPKDNFGEFKPLLEGILEGILEGMLEAGGEDGAPERAEFFELSLEELKNSENYVDLFERLKTIIEEKVTSPLNPNYGLYGSHNCSFTRFIVVTKNELKLYSISNNNREIQEITGGDEPVINIEDFLEDIENKNYKMDFKAFLWLFNKIENEQS